MHVRRRCRHTACPHAHRYRRYPGVFRLDRYEFDVSPDLLALGASCGAAQKKSLSRGMVLVGCIYWDDGENCADARMHTGIYTCSQLLVPKARASPCVSHASLMRCNTANGLEHFAASRNCHGNAANVPAGFKLAAEGTLLTDIKPRAGTLKGVDNVEANHTARASVLANRQVFSPNLSRMCPTMHARAQQNCAEPVWERGSCNKSSVRV